MFHVWRFHVVFRLTLLFTLFKTLNRQKSVVVEKYQRGTKTFFRRRPRAGAEKKTGKGPPSLAELTLDSDATFPAVTYTGQQ